MPTDEHDGGGRRAGVSVPGRPGPTPGLYLRGGALPRAELGDLLGHR